LKTLKNTVAIVTGAGRGIGKGIAECLAEEGATVIIATIDPAEGEATAESICKSGGHAYFIHTDVENEESIVRMVQETIQQFGSIDILVNNAGITKFIPIEEATIEDWNKIVNIDLRGAFLCSKYVVPHMKKKRKGSIIHISSNHSLATLPNSEIYAAAKGGLLAMTRSMALSLGEWGIRVNAICPGFTDTPHYQAWLDSYSNRSEAHEEVLRLHPLKRICKPKDIGKLVVYLAGDDAAMVTGEQIVIDGGMTARLYHSDLIE
jgi:NAD(P)-dependent dehydrogenase (short-subunit alcohol dehydrogenase family)